MRQQYKITLGDELRGRLDAASKANRRPLSDEIRRRLEDSFSVSSTDEATRALAAVVIEMAAEIKAEVGDDWHSHPGAYRTFRRAILMALAKWRPEGVPESTLEKVSLPPFQQRTHASHPTNDADELGVWIAHDVLEQLDADLRARVREAREQALKAVVDLQQNIAKLQGRNSHD